MFRQRGHLDTFHGYGIQDFLDIDPHFGTRRDLVELVAAAHAEKMRIILDIIFNHSGANWIYPDNTRGGAFQPHYTTGRYSFGSWLDADGHRTTSISGDDDGVWPDDLQETECYTRAGSGNLGAGDIDDPNAEHKRSDFLSLRDFRLDRSLNLLSLGIPCLYYGTEQALAGPESGEQKWLDGWKRNDRFLREAMFGPLHPCKSGRAGLDTTSARLHRSLPGFGPFGTAGQHCFDERSSAFLRIAALTAIRRRFPALRCGRQYHRATRFLSVPFGFHGPGELLAWSRILDDEEFLCVVNTHGMAARGADIIVDAHLNQASDGTDRPLTVVLNSQQSAASDPAGYSGPCPVGTRVPVRRDPSGTAYVELRNIAPSEIIVLANYP